MVKAFHRVQAFKAKPTFDFGRIEEITHLPDLTPAGLQYITARLRIKVREEGQTLGDW